LGEAGRLIGAEQPQHEPNRQDALDDAEQQPDRLHHPIRRSPAVRERIVRRRVNLVDSGGSGWCHDGGTRRRHVSRSGGTVDGALDNLMLGDLAIDRINYLSSLIPSFLHHKPRFQ